MVDWADDEESGRKIDAVLKARIAVEALQGRSTVADLSQRYGSSHEPDLRLEEAAAGAGGP